MKDVELILTMSRLSSTVFTVPPMQLKIPRAQDWGYTFQTQLLNLMGDRFGLTLNIKKVQKSAFAFL